MPPEERRLAAIMFTDMVGYSSLTQRDEPLALELLSVHNTILRPVFADHAGTVVKTIGDAFLAEFASVTDAVKCGLAVQHALQDYNDGAPAARRMQIRIGVHVGDVLHRENDVFGDGVNLAARIEPLANPGGICISRQVYDQVRGRVDAPMVDAGQFELKNITEPQQVYRVLLPWQNADDEEVRTQVHHVGQSIVVLPFADMSEKKDQEFFCDGITEELLDGLAKIEGLKVVARTSSFAFKGKNVDIKEIGRTLGVRTVLEGSVRKSGNRIRVTAQLINVKDGYHLFSEKYDGTAADIFAIQEEISLAIIAALKVKLLGGDKVRLARHHTQNTEAHGLYLQGQFYWNMRQRHAFKKALDFYRKAIATDPGYARPYVGIAETFSMMGTYGFVAPREVYPRAKEVAQRALAIDECMGEAHVSIAWINAVYEHAWQRAETTFKHGISLTPNYATGHTLYGMYLLMRAKFKQAAASMARAHELDPLSVIITADRGIIASFSRDYDKAVAFLEKALGMHKKFYLAYTWLGMTHLGRGDFTAAADVLHTQLGKEGKTALSLGHLGLTYGLAGKHAACREVLEQFKRLSGGRRYVSPYCRGIIHLGLGEPDDAFEWFDKAYEERDTSLDYLHALPVLLPERSGFTRDPRFEALIRKMNLYDDIAHLYFGPT